MCVCVCVDICYLKLIFLFLQVTHFVHKGIQLIVGFQKNYFAVVIPHYSGVH